MLRNWIFDNKTLTNIFQKVSRKNEYIEQDMKEVCERKKLTVKKVFCFIDFVKRMVVCA